MQGEEIFNTAKLRQLIPQTSWEKFVPHSNYKGETFTMVVTFYGKEIPML